MNRTDEIARWDGETGAKWVRHADSLDRMLAPFGEAVLETLTDEPGPILDVGCGAGALTISAALQTGGAVGVDVSDALLTLARARASAAKASAKFLRRDAAQHRGSAPYESVISRFGVMFFDDPVGAFANIRAATRARSTLTFVAWRDLSLNPWASLPVRMAEPLLGQALPRPTVGQPGPFAFANADYVRGILEQAEWAQVDLQPLRARIVLPSDVPEGAADFLVRLGPLSRKLEEAGIATEALRDVVADELVVDGEGTIALPGEAWLVRATA